MALFIGSQQLKNKFSIKEQLNNECYWFTNIGKWEPSQHIIYRKRNLHKPPYETSWMSLLLYGITAKQFNHRQIKLFEAIWTLSTSYPEPRIWNNRVASLAGTAKSTGALGVSAATATSEAIIYGLQPLYACASMLTDINIALHKGSLLRDLLSERILKNKQTNKRPSSGKNRSVAGIPGYGRPLIKKDERITPLLDLAHELKLDKGEYTRLAIRIDQQLKDMDSALSMNIAPIMAGLFLDQGLTSKDFYYFCILCFSAGIMPCFIDAVEQPQGTFFPIQCKNINYQGVPHRKWKK